MTAPPEIALHGGSGFDFLGACYPQAPKPWLDLSTGINPWPYERGASDAAWAALPSGSLIAACRESAAQYFGAPQDTVAILPGSQAAISLLPRLFSARSVAVVEPTYCEHAKSWHDAGHAVTAAYTLADADAEIVVVTNPNNPDGRSAGTPALLSALDKQSARKGWLVVDEAFGDLLPDETLKDVYGANGLIALRSFGKFFGLAGIRLGFAIAPPDIARKLEAMVGPWGVSGPALEVGARAYGDKAWQGATRAKLSSASTQQRQILQKTGLRDLCGTSLYTLAMHPRAPQLFHHLCRHGLYVRRFAGHPEWLRFGLAENSGALARLEDALISWAQS